MKKSWLFWVLIIVILLVIGLTVYGLLWGFSGQGSDIIDGNIEEDSLIGQGVGLVDDIKGDTDAQRERDLGRLIAGEDS